MQITMQKIRIEITKTNKTPAKNWNIPLDVVVILCVKFDCSWNLNVWDRRLRSLEKLFLLKSRGGYDIYVTHHNITYLCYLFAFQKFAVRTWVGGRHACRGTGLSPPVGLGTGPLPQETSSGPPQARPRQCHSFRLSSLSLSRCLTMLTLPPSLKGKSWGVLLDLTPPPHSKWCS